jgi:ActR/RegA family two-component response regulator
VITGYASIESTVDAMKRGLVGKIVVVEKGSMAGIDAAFDALT